MYHPAQALSFGRLVRRDEPSLWRRLTMLWLAWRRPSTAVVLRRLEAYRRWIGCDAGL